MVDSWLKKKRRIAHREQNTTFCLYLSYAWNCLLIVGLELVLLVPPAWDAADSLAWRVYTGESW